MASYQKMARFLEVEGTAYEISFKQGRAFRNSYEQVFQSLTKTPIVPSWLQWAIPKFAFRNYLNKIGRKYLNLHSSLLESYRARNHLRNLEGLAAGFGQTKENLYGMNAIEITTADMPFTMGCTSLAFGAHNIQDNVPKLIYNHDFPEAFEPFLYVQKNCSTQGHTSLCLTYPVILGSIAGINDQGLAITLNHAFATDLNKKPGILFTLLVQECLTNCANVSEAIELIKETPVPNGSMMTLIDKSGARVTAEISCTQKSFRNANDDVLYTFNSYQQPEMQAVQIPQQARPKGMAKLITKNRLVHAHNIQREKRYLEIIDNNKKYADYEIHSLISDHNGTGGEFSTICRHEAKTMSTIASAILDPTNQQIKVIYGKPCWGMYRKYSLNECERDVA